MDKTPVNFEKMDIFQIFLKTVLINENIKIWDLYICRLTKQKNGHLH